MPVLRIIRKPQPLARPVLDLAGGESPETALDRFERVGRRQQRADVRFRQIQRQAGSLGRLLDEADRGVAVIVDAPELANDRGRRRRYLMPRFPYATYYRDFPDRLHTLAFKHSRHPDYWRYRISE